MVTTPVLVLPGYGDSGPEHWQSRWQAAGANFRRVLQRDWLMPERAEWLATLEREVAACPAPPVLVAHSLGCALVAHRVMAGGGGIKAALLVAPADVDMLATVLEAGQSFAPVPPLPPPFPGVVVASTHHPDAGPARARAFPRAR